MKIALSRFCQRFTLDTPIALAPMALASGGALAAATARAGALGLVGGGYADFAWTQREYGLALAQGPRERIGCGFITWKLDEDASALDWVLEQRPRAVMLSFGDPRPYAARIAAGGAALICQVQRMEQVPQAIEAGASVIVAQGGEAGGHGMNPLNARATMTLVPELADWLAAH
ncbi:MAG: nitronate monooxygenase, partial [Comamonadaceae bacterium]